MTFNDLVYTSLTPKLTASVEARSVVITGVLVKKFLFLFASRRLKHHR